MSVLNHYNFPLILFSLPHPYHIFPTPTESAKLTIWSSLLAFTVDVAAILNFHQLKFFKNLLYSA